MNTELALTETGFVNQLEATKLVALREIFRAQQSIYLPHFMSSGLLDKIKELVRHQVNVAAYVADKRDFYEVEKLPFSKLQMKLGMIFSDASLVKFAQELSGRSGFEGVEVGIQRMTDESHFIDWHCDNNGYRKLALSINLSEESYTGGDFQIRRHPSEELLASFHSAHPGDAHFFAIDETLRHRVTPLQGHGVRSFLNLWYGTPNPMNFRSLDASFHTT